MTNIMSQVRFSNKPSRNAFDLSRKLGYSAKAGELLPIFVEETIPGDKFRISPKWFTRTEPLNTAAYTRLTEYMDFYFVPTRLLWRYADSFFAQTDFSQSALSLTNSGLTSPSSHPYMYLSDVLYLLHHRKVNFNDASVSESNINKYANFFGFSRYSQTVKLLEYLGYGNMSQYLTSDDDVDFPIDFKLNMFPLLAYQCIYQYYERNDAWERMNCNFFNVDYLGQSTFRLDPTDLIDSTDDMFDLRYSNFRKDLFTGLLPSAQYGDEATASIIGTGEPISYRFSLNSGDTTNADVTNENISLVNGLISNNGSPTITKLRLSNEVGILPILALRQAEFLQRYKEIKQSNKYDYRSQIEAFWNVNVSRERALMPTRIGGFVNGINIDEVVNTSITDNGDERQAANIAGKGAGAGQGTLTFDAKENGYIIGIYKVMPELDYLVNGLSRMHTRTTYEDYANPMFDKLGMESVKASEMILSPLLSLIGDGNAQAIANMPLGYAPRYYDYKTAVDKVVGAFGTQYLDTWVAPYTSDQIIRMLRTNYKQGGRLITYPFFKVNPAMLNPIFVNQIRNADVQNLMISDYSNEQFKINCFFECTAVRNLDYNGLPY